MAHTPFMVYERFRAFALIVCLSLPVMTQAGAQDSMILPNAEELSEGEGAAFRQCQLAMVYERSAREKSDLPPAFMTAMEEQIGFILADTMFNLPALSFEDTMTRLGFIEEWFVGFGRDMMAAEPAIADPAMRGKILIECQALVWAIIRNHIDTLIDWRTKAMGTLDTPRLNFRSVPAE